MDSLADAKELIKKLHPKSEVKIDWDTCTLHSEFGVLELLPGGQWVLNGDEIKTSALRKVLGQRPGDIPKKEIFLEKVADSVKGVADLNALTDLTKKRIEKAFAIPALTKKPRKKRAPMTPEQRARAIVALESARTAKKAKKALENHLNEVLA